MVLTPALVDAYKKIALNPREYGLSFRPLNDCFRQASIVTANHLLFKAYSTHEAPNMPKLIFYIIMNDIYGQPFQKDSDGQPFQKDSDGHLGYPLEFIL